MILVSTQKQYFFGMTQNEKGHFPLFVMHRINDWHYIHKEQNPADLS